MERTPQQSKDILSYLLGQLSPAEQERFEERYFSDNQFFIEVLDTQDQLIESYLRGDLSVSEKQRFEQHFLTTTCRQRKLEFVHLLNQSKVRQSIINPKMEAAPNPSLKQPFLSRLKVGRIHVLVPVMASLLILSLISLSVIKQRSSEQSLPATAKIEPPQPAGHSVVSLYLEPGSATRSGISPTVPTAYYGSETRSVELKLKLFEVIYPTYRGRLQKKDEGRREVAKNESLKPEGDGDAKVVIWKLGADKLPVGDYQVKLEGVTPHGDSGDVSSYDFNIRDR